jgi:hypothetical protein
MPALSRNCILGFSFDRLRMSGRRKDTEEVRSPA